MSEPEDLLAAERQVAGEMTRHLGGLPTLCDLTFDLIGGSLAEAADHDTVTGRIARRVSVLLLTRVANDLRVASRVACTGYALQSMSLVAGLYEFALTIIHVGPSEELALKWRDYANPLRPLWSVKTLTTSAAGKTAPKDPGDVANRLYRCYTQLCLAKHGHPRSEIQHVTGRTPDSPDSMLIVQGPDASEPSVRSAWFALLQALGLALLAQGRFALDHLPSGSRRDKLLTVRATLDERRGHLVRQSVERWPGGDPFPGQWARL